MNFKKLESGRSMVEMLGVLAIIGVLSVGGIAGYSLSMRRHRANVIVDLANKYGLVAYNQCYQRILNGEKANNGSFTGCTSGDISFENTDMGELPAGVGYFAHTTVDDETDTISVLTNFTDQKLCQAVASAVGSSCIAITGGGSEFSGGLVTIKIKQN